MVTEDPFRIVRIDDLPWEPHVMGRSIRKVVDLDPSVDSYVHYRYSPPGGGNPKVRRLHLSISETFFFLGGALPNWEFDSPEDTEGRIVDLREGIFMDRLPYSVHGTGPDLASPTGSTFLMWTSGGGEFEADTAESIKIPFFGEMPRFNEPYTDPILVDTRELPWEAHPSNDGWRRRTISTDAAGTITPRPVSVTFVPPDWKPSSRHVLGPVAHRSFCFVISGGLLVRADQQSHQLDEKSYFRWNAGQTPELSGSSPVGCTLLCAGHDLAAS